MAARSKGKGKKPTKTLTQMISEKTYGVTKKRYKVLDSTKPLWGIVEFDLNSPAEEEESDEREEI